MNVDIYIRDKKGGRDVRIPWLPESIKCESGGSVRATFDILNRGPVEVPTGSGLKKYSWEGILPGENRDNMSMFGRGWRSPEEYINIFEDWKTKGTVLHFMVTGYPFNTDVILDDYTASAEGGFGDIAYKITLIEHRDITIQATVIEPSAPAPAETPAPSRPTTEGTTYTVKSGDNLWTLAQSKLGNGTRNKDIYEANKDIIEATAKKYGKSSSNNGWWIYPGTVLTIPAK